jgi:hypothetical protein
VLDPSFVFTSNGPFWPELVSRVLFQIVFLYGEVIPLRGFDVAVTSQPLYHMDWQKFCPIGDAGATQIMHGALGYLCPFP